MRSIEEEQNPNASNDFKTMAQATDRLWPPWNRTKLSNNNDNNEDSHHNNMIGVLMPHFQKVFVIVMVIDDLIVVGLAAMTFSTSSSPACANSSSSTSIPWSFLWSSSSLESINHMSSKVVTLWFVLAVMCW